MTIYAIALTNSEGEIKSIYTPGGLIPAEGTCDEDTSLTVHHIKEMVDHATFLATKYYKDGEWKTREDKTNTYYIWKDEAWTVDSTTLWNHIRDERNRRLYLCDWTQLGDAPLTDAKKTAWGEYRVALREVPSENSTVADLIEVVWPDEPS